MSVTNSEHFMWLYLIQNKTNLMWLFIHLENANFCYPKIASLTIARILRDLDQFEQYCLSLLDGAYNDIYYRLFIDNHGIL